MSILKHLFAKKRNADISIPLPEGTTLRKLYFHEYGSMLLPYYIFCGTENGSVMKATDTAPYRLSQKTENLSAEEMKLFNCFDKVIASNERASVFLSDDETTVKALEKIVVQSGALGWKKSGKSRRHSRRVMDGDSGFRVYIELSDGTVVNTDSCNGHTDSYRILGDGIRDLFKENGVYLP